MISFKWYYVIILAILFQFALLAFRSTIHPLESDALSAIQRAKTNSCKRELEEFARRINDIDYSTIQLERSCPLDTNVQRNQMLGCVTNLTRGILKIDNSVGNASICLDLCFSYGHGYGGFDDNDCYCGNSAADVNANQNQSSNCQLPDQFPWYKVNNGIYTLNDLEKSPLSPATSKDGQLRIAFLLIVSGRDVLQVKRLVDNIYSQSHLYYIHVDRSDNYLFSKLTDLYKENDNIIMANTRYRTIWGGTSLLRMVLDSIKRLMSFEWDYLINLSESDFPLKTLDALESFLSQDISSIYLKSHSIEGHEFVKKQGLDWSFYECEDRVWRMGKRNLPRGIVYSGGSDWFGLPRYFCQYIENNLAKSNSLVKPLLQVFNHTLLPAESFFHTIALNSEFCDRFRNNNLRTTNWNRKMGCKCQHRDVVDWCGCSPLVYRSSDWDKLQQLRKDKTLFLARKFDPTISASVLSAIEHNIKLNDDNQTSRNLDTRHWKNVYSFNRSSPIERLNYGLMFEEFAAFATHQLDHNLTNNYTLESVDLYFDQDRFVGILLLHCTKIDPTTTICNQMLVERQVRVYRRTNNCLNASGRSLVAIEISQRFDAGERLFRDYSPLNHLSDIVVYHRWKFGDLPTRTKNSTDDLKFLWFHHPNHYPELVQDVKLKRLSSNKLRVLAHRLTIAQPIKSGTWTLVIRDGNLDCLKYGFLVFSERSLSGGLIKQEQFNQHYKVTSNCTTILKGLNAISGCNDCSRYNWSSISVG